MWNWEGVPFTVMLVPLLYLALPSCLEPLRTGVLLLVCWLDCLISALELPGAGLGHTRDARRRKERGALWEPARAEAHAPLGLPGEWDKPP